MLYLRQIRMVINNLIAEAALVVWTQNLFFLVSAHTLVTVSAHTSRCSDSSCVLSMYSGFPPIHQHIPSTFSTVFLQGWCGLFHTCYTSVDIMRLLWCEDVLTLLFMHNMHCIYVYVFLHWIRTETARPLVVYQLYFLHI